MVRADSAAEYVFAVDLLQGADVGVDDDGVVEVEALPNLCAAQPASCACNTSFD